MRFVARELNKPTVLVCLVLALGTLACYWPARHFAFVNLDDPLYVSQTPMVQRGLSWAGVVWAFQSVKAGNWNPLVWLSHMADCQLYGLNPGGHHVTNLLLHCANALLLFLVLKRMTGTAWRSGLVAAIFAWHPMHVESVAWISERKDVLSTFFFLLTLWAYARYAAVQDRMSKVQSPKSKVQGPQTEVAGLSAGSGSTFEVQGSKFEVPPSSPAFPFHLPSTIFYLLSLLFFACGLMSKSMLVTLPFVLLLLDYWPLQRRRLKTQNPRLRTLLWEKLPFAVLGLTASALAVWTQHHDNTFGTQPLPLRLENAAVSYVTYLGKFFWPVNLAAFYPYPDSIPLWRAGGAALALAAISWPVIREMKRRRYLGVGWFWFLGTLVPVIGLLQVGMQALADRYTYIPYIGLAVMVSWGLADWAAAWPRGRTALAWVAALALGGCLATTRCQVNSWRDSTALYEHAQIAFFVLWGAKDFVERCKASFKISNFAVIIGFF